MRGRGLFTILPCQPTYRPIELQRWRPLTNILVSNQLHLDFISPFFIYFQWIIVLFYRYWPRPRKNSTSVYLGYSGQSNRQRAQAMAEAHVWTEHPADNLFQSSGMLFNSYISKHKINVTITIVFYLDYASIPNFIWKCRGDFRQAEKFWIDLNNSNEQ